LAYNYFARYESPDLFACRAATRAFFVLPKSDDQGEEESLQREAIEERLEAMRGYAFPDLLSIFLIPNFFEELAGMYNRGLIDREVTKHYLGAVSLAVWNDLYWFVGRERQKNPNTYIEWLEMLRDVAPWVARRQGVELSRLDPGGELQPSGEEKWRGVNVGMSLRWRRRRDRERERG
jgi:hypothetical protein